MAISITPKLRFKEFTDEWQEKKIGEVASIERGRFSPRPRNDPKYYGGNIPFVQTGDVIKANGIISEFTQTLNDDGLKVSKLFPKGTILITIAANIGYTGILKIDMACPDSLIGIKCKNNLISNRFLNYYLSTQQKYMNRIASEAAQKNINIEFLRPYKTPITNLQEQEKIAEFLTTVDEKISWLEKKKTQFEKYKKGVMQKIFSGKIRFKNSAGKNFPDWEEKKLGEIGKTYNGLTGKTAKDFGEGSPFVTYMQIFQNALFGKMSKFGYVRIKNNENQNKIKKGDILFTTSSETPEEVGFSSAFLDEINSDIYLNSFCFGYRLNDIEKTLPKFLRFLFRSEFFRKKVIKLAQGSTRFNLSKNELMKAKINLPNTEEQEKIAEFLTSIDNKVDLINNQLEQAKVFKKGLLQRMFA